MKRSLGFEIFMTALVLVVIAGVAGALLGFVNHFTAVSEDEQFSRKASAVYDGELALYHPEGIEAVPEYVNGDVISVHVPTDPAKKDTYILVTEGKGAYKGTLRLLVNITKGKIVKIATYEANETPGLGSKALQESFFKQYYDRPITPGFGGFALKNPAPAAQEVHAVSGASKSSTAITNAVNAAVKWYQVRVLGGETV